MFQVKTSSPIAPCGEHLGPCPPEAASSKGGDIKEGLPIYNVNNTASYDKALSEQALLDADAGSRYWVATESCCQISQFGSHY